ncbi:MAG: two-component system cell cycle response regulator [Methylophagaceae bacterium]|jgi:two-component system cell cycle response regulator
MSLRAELLQNKLDALLTIASHNEQKQTHFQEYELSLLNSSGLFDLLSIILDKHQIQFQLTEVTLMLLDPEYEFQRLLDSHNLPSSWQGRLIFADSEQSLQQHYKVPHRTRLAEFTSQQHQALFSNNSTLRSVAILPLHRQNKLLGSLNLGSRQVDRFQAGIGTQFLQHLTAVISACLENARLQESIKQLGLRDPLTGINNRRFFDQRVIEETSLARRNTTPLSCLFIDLDYFKSINDKHGHQAGDIVLKQAAKIFNDIMRTSDILARYGGEEFVILLTNTPLQTAYEIAERIRKTIATNDFIISSTESINMTLSIGIAVLDAGTLIATSQQLIKAADKAVYAAKINGRNQVHHAI